MRGAESFDLIQIGKGNWTPITYARTWSGSSKTWCLGFRVDGADILSVKTVDLSSENYQAARDINSRLAPLVDQIADCKRGIHALEGARITLGSLAKRILHFELSADPNKAQEEGFAQVRDYAKRFSYEWGVDLDIVVATPSGKLMLRPPKP